MPKKLKKILVILLIAVILFGLLKFFKVEDVVMRNMYPQKYSEYVIKYAEEFDVDPLLVYAVIKVESNFDKSVVSKKNAKGVMQLMDTTAEEVAGNIMSKEEFNLDMLFDAEINIKLGTKYLSDLLNKYNQNYYIAVAAYNAGSGTVDKWINEGVIKSDGSDIENIPYKETNNYVRKIIRNYGIYEKLYG